MRKKNKNNIYNSRRKSYYRRKNKSISKILLVMLLVISLFGLGVGGYIYYKIRPNTEQQNYATYFESEKQFVSYEDEYLQIDYPVVVENDEILIPVELAHEVASEYIFYEPDYKRLNYTTYDKVMYYILGEENYYVNDVPTPLDITILDRNNTAYLPMTFINENFPVEFDYNPEIGILSINDTKNSSTYATTKKNVDMHYKADKDSFVTTTVEANTEVETFGTYANNKYTKIKSPDGHLGYVFTNQLKNKYTAESSYVKATSPKLLLDEPILLLWDQVSNVTANTTSFRADAPDYVNVLSPTWFEFDTDKLDGTIISVGDISYTNTAHNNNAQVWGLLSDSFSNEICSSILRNPNARAKAVDELIYYANVLDLDGINVDFEAVPSSDADHFIQFLRELAVPMHEQGLILSVDTFVPTAWSEYYNRDAIADTADYVAVMTYDEFTVHSDQIGPVASLEFVENGIVDTIKEVPKEQILMGIPLYTRVWIQTPEGMKISNMPMGDAVDYFRENNATFEKQPSLGYTYATFTEEGKIYEAWLETPESIAKKMEIYKKTDVAGVALWKRGLADSSVIKLIYDNLK